MNKMKKLLSVVLAVVLALSAFSVMGSAAKTNYKTVADLEALDAYSPYGQVTRLSLEERTSIVLDFLDNVLPGLNINMGEVFNVLGLSVTIDLTSVDRLCYSFDTIKSTFTNTLASIAMGIVDLGILESLNVDSWATGMTRAGTAQFTILSEILEFLSSNTTLIGKVFTDGLDLGLVSLGDMSAIEDIIFNLPGLVKGLVYPMIERWDDTLDMVKMYDNSIAGTGKNVEEIANLRVKELFNDNMSITTVKYDVNGNMTSEHTGMPIYTAAPGTPTANSPRCYYQITGTTPGSVMTVYHIVDADEAKTLAKTPDEINGSPAAYTYFKEKQTYVMTQEVEGSDTYVWQATDEWGNKWSMKWYNDDSQWLADFGITGDDIDLRSDNVSLADLLYTFVPAVFEAMAPTVLNGSVKKILAEFLGAKFTYVGQGGPEADEAVMALADSSNAFFTEEQGEYLWEWSNYAIINGTHYYRFEDQIFVGDLSQKNNYFDIINWDFEITGDFMNEFVPENGGTTNDTLLMEFNNFLVKVAEEVLLPSASTVDTISGFEKEWVRPDLEALKGDNSKLVNTLKTIAQAIIGLAPQHVFGDDYAENERCYVELMLVEDNNDTVLAGIAAHLVNMIMPSVSLPGKSDLLASNAKVGAILAAVIREFAAYLAPEYNFDALIYADFGTTSADKVKSFVDPATAGLLSAGQTASGYWFDVCLTMGINVGFEYLRAFSDMGEGTEEWNAFVAYSGYGVDGKTYAAGTTQAALNAEWEGMLDYIIDWALTTDKEWCWKMGNLVTVDINGDGKVDSNDVNLKTAEDPFVKLDKVLLGLLPITEVLNITGTNSTSKVEQFLRYDLILGLVDLKWGALLDTLKVPNGFVRDGNILDTLAGELKGIVNFLFKKLGGGSFELIPSAITDFDSLANQSNLVTMVKSLVGVLYTGLVTNKGLDTIMPFLNFLLGWKTDPQVIKDPQIWTSFRDGNDYAFQWTSNGVYPTMDADNTKIVILNDSSGMLETHRNSDVTDHAYDIQIKSVTSDATVNDLKFTFSDGNGLVSPWEQVEIKVGGTYKGEEAVTVTIAYDYVGKDGNAVGGTQYTSVSFLISNQYEDSNVDGRWSGDDDDDYTGTNQYKKYVFTEDLYTSVTTYEPTIFYVKPSINLGATSKDFKQICANGEKQDCNGNITSAGDVPQGQSTQYFEWIRDKNEAGWENSISDGNPASGRLYKAKAGVTADTEFPYGDYDMGNIAVQYGGTMVYEVNFIYYNDYDIDVLYAENKDNGYNANQGVDSATWEAYRTAWNKIVYLATYPMMTAMNGNSATAYVTTIQTQIPAAIEAFETAKEAYETALAEAQATGSSDSALPAYIEALADEIDDDFMNGKEINFQDYNFYEYFNYNDVKVAGENMYRTYLAPEVMDTYYILNSGIREAELNDVIAAESNPFIAAGITASRMENDASAVAESQRLHDEWKMPTTSKLTVEDMTARIAYYKQFLNAANMEDANRAEPAHLYFLKQEIAHIDAQGLDAENYTAASWAKFEEYYDIATAVAAGNDEFADFNSRIYDVKYNLMVAYKNLLEKDASLIEAGGTADLLANIDTAEAIFASLEAGDGEWALAEEYEGEADAAYAQLISALGYYYEGEDGNTWNLYADSAYEYRDNDRPLNQNNQAKVNTANTNLEAAIANFAMAAPEMEPSTLMVKEDYEYADYVVIDTNNNNYGEFTGIVYGIDIFDQNPDFTAYASDLASVLTTNNGDDYLIIEANENGTESTGAIITVVDENGEVLETYAFVYFGDIDGDGMITGGDGFIASEYEMTYEGIYSYASYVAGDIEVDGMVTGGDGFIMSEYEMSYEGVDFQYNLSQLAVDCTYEWIY